MNAELLSCPLCAYIVIYSTEKYTIVNRGLIFSSIGDLISIPCSNAFVESVFSAMKHLYDDKRNRMSMKLAAAELKIRFNSSLSCTEIYNFFLSKPELLKPIHSNEKYCAKKQRVNQLEIV
ncbi:unnamed protein product [Rotaria magnacalcarata]